MFTPTRCTIAQNYVIRPFEFLYFIILIRFIDGAMTHSNIFKFFRALKERLTALQPSGQMKRKNCQRKGVKKFVIQTIEEVAQLERRIFRST